jgi:hypothetical protein
MLTDLQINQRMAALSGYEIVEGHDPQVCYVETRTDEQAVPRVLVYDVLNCNDMTLQAIKMNHLDVTWDGEQVTVHLPMRLKPRDFISYTHCDGDVSRAVSLLLLNAIGNDKP